MKKRGRKGKDVVSNAITRLKYILDIRQFEDEVSADLRELLGDLEQLETVNSKSSKLSIQFNDCMEYAPYGILILNASGLILESNYAASSQMGYSKDELLSLSFVNLISSLTSIEEAGGSNFNDLLKSSRWTGELILKKKNGTEFYVSVKTKKKSEDRLLVFIIDVDQQKITENALIESQIKNHAFSEVTREAIFITYQGHCIESNPAASLMFGYSYEEFMGQFASFISSPESAETIRTNILKGVTTPYEAILQKKDGAKFWAEIHGRNYQYKGKNVRVTSIKDISQRKQYELDLKKTINDLRESEDKNRALSDASKEGIIFSDKGICVECNQAACDLFGYTHDELIGIFGTDVIAPESRDLVRQNMISGYEKPYEAVAQRKDGSKFIGEFQGKMYHYKNQRVRLTYVRDISAQKKAEQELKEVEQKLRLFAENTNDVIWTLDNQLNFIYISPSVEKALGYSPDKIVGTPLFNLLTKRSRTLVQKAVDNYREKPELNNSGLRPRNIELELIHNDGSIVWAEAQANAIVDNYQNIEFITGVSRDITQWKKDEIQLRQAADIMENIQSGIHLYQLENLDDDRTLRLIAANPAAEKITGVPTEQIIGKTLDENFPNLRDLGIPQNYARVVRTGVPLTIDTIDYEDSKIAALNVSLKAFPLPNNCVGVSFESLSELKKTQNELQIRNSELNNFVYKVSHDLRAPLASIKGLIHLAKYEKGPDEFLTRIDDSIRKLDDFIQNVLSHSRNLNTTPIVDDIDFSTLIDQCFSELNYLPGVTRLQKKVIVKGCHFYNDSIRIFEIFRNMISNAIKYQDPEKKKSLLSITIDVTPDAANLVIEDNGVGIDEEHLPKIYTMFYRASEKSDGSGIGLYIVHQALQKINGTIKVTSELNQGTTFSISIPNLKQKD
jgi:PAS domain S-box-containing protein